MATSEIRRDLMKLYANIDESEEMIIQPSVQSASPIMPKAEEPRPMEIPRITGWPFDAARAKELQAQAEYDAQCTMDLGNGIKLDMTLIPAGQFIMGDNRGHQDETPATAVKVSEPFLMGTCEITNAQFSEFDPSHDSRLEVEPGIESLWAMRVLFVSIQHLQNLTTIGD